MICESLSENSTLSIQGCTGRGSAHTIQVDHHRRAKFEAGQIAHLPLVGVIHLVEFPTTPGTHQFPIPSFPSYPQLQRLSAFVDLMAIHPIPGPSQDFGPVGLSHPAECTQSSRKSKTSCDTIQRNAICDSWLSDSGSFLPRRNARRRTRRHARPAEKWPVDRKGFGEKTHDVHLWRLRAARSRSRDCGWLS